MPGWGKALLSCICMRALPTHCARHATPVIHPGIGLCSVRWTTASSTTQPSLAPLPLPAGYAGVSTLQSESGPNRMMDRLQGRVVLNSTLVIPLLSALRQSKPLSFTWAWPSTPWRPCHKQGRNALGRSQAPASLPWRTLSACSKSMPMAEAISPPLRVSTLGH